MSNEIKNVRLRNLGSWVRAGYIRSLVLMETGQERRKPSHGAEIIVDTSIPDQTTYSVSRVSPRGLQLERRYTETENPAGNTYTFEAIRTSTKGTRITTVVDVFPTNSPPQTTLTSDKK